MRMAMGIGALALLFVVGSAQAEAKAPKNGKIRAEAMLGDDGPRLHQFVQWRAVPIVEGAPAEVETPAEEPVDAPTDAPADGEEATAEEPEAPAGPPPIELGGGELDGQLPPGRYMLQAVIAPEVMEKEIEVRSGKRMKLEYVFEGAFVEYAPKNATGEFECGSTNGKQTRSFKASQPTQRFFSPGIWEVTCHRGVLSTGSVIKLNAGNMVKITPDLSVGRLNAAVIGTADYPDEVYFELRDVGPEAPKGNPLTVYAEKGKTLSIDVPPGAYQVYAKMAFDRPVPDLISIDGTARSNMDVGQTVELEIDIPWAMVLPKLEIGRRARTPGETRWFLRDPATDDERPLAIRLKPQGTPFTVHAFEQPIVIEVHDEFDRIIGVSAPFVPAKHTTTEVPIKIR